MRVAVVILNFNGRDHLATYLPSVIRENQNQYTIIIADNASTDDSIRWLRATYPDIQVLKNDSNYGFAGGYNVALTQIESEFDAYLLLNSDVEVTPNWLQPLVNELTTNPKVAAVQPKILAWRDKTKFEHAGACGGFLDKYYFPFCRGRIFDHVEKDEGQYQQTIEVAWTSGAAMLIRADVFHKVGGFDASFFAHMEEIDLCVRLQRKGFTLRVVPTSTVYHLGGGTLDYNSPRKVYLNFRNSLFMLVKNHPRAWFPTLFIRMALDGIAAFKFLFEGKPKLLWMVFLAHVHLYSNLPRLIRQRKRLSNDKQMFKQTQFSIVFRYFLKGQKTFDRLKTS